MKQVWRKRWINMGWAALGAVTIILLAAGVYKKNHKTCTGIEVVFDGDGNNFFIDEKGVTAILKTNGVEPGMEIEKINLRSLEDKLKQDQWIANAELYFDNKQMLKAAIKEKEPIARVFTADGSSFYIDSSCRRLPLSQKLSARIPMFTGFPSDRPVLSKPDSALLSSTKKLAMFIQADEFWKAQVAQVDITPDGFEMIPTVGSHIVLLGKDDNFQEKFDRLFSFYKQVWTKVGFETYEKLDVRFNGQVVATLKGTKATQLIDSAKAKAALETLVANDKPDTTDSEDESPEAIVVPASVASHPVVVSHATVAKDTTVAKAKAPARLKPHAVMPMPMAVNHLLPKASTKKLKVAKHALTAEEEKIRKEALKHLNQHQGKQPVIKKKLPAGKPKAVLPQRQ